MRMSHAIDTLLTLAWTRESCRVGFFTTPILVGGPTQATTATWRLSGAFKPWRVSPILNTHEQKVPPNISPWDRWFFLSLPSRLGAIRDLQVGFGQAEATAICFSVALLNQHQFRRFASIMKFGPKDPPTLWCLTGGSEPMVFSKYLPNHFRKHLRTIP